MRRLLVIGTLLVAGVLFTPAFGALMERTPGSAEFELRGGAGVAKIRFRGTVLGFVSRGRIVATENVTVTGWTSHRRVSNALTAYHGSNLRFRVFSTDGRWRLQLRGRGISAGGFVRGCMVLNGVDSGPTGMFRINSADFRRWPRRATGYRLGAGC